MELISELTLPAAAARLNCPGLCPERRRGGRGGADGSPRSLPVGLCAAAARQTVPGGSACRQAAVAGALTRRRTASTRNRIAAIGQSPMRLCLNRNSNGILLLARAPADPPACVGVGVCALVCLFPCLCVRGRTRGVDRARDGALRVLSPMKHESACWTERGEEMEAAGRKRVGRREEASGAKRVPRRPPPRPSRV